MDVSALKSASEKANEAEWEGDLPDLPGVRVCVRSFSSHKVSRALSRAMRKEMDEDGNISPEAQDAIDLEVIATAVLVDWDGLTKDGKPLEYSVEMARELLSVELFAAGVNVAASRVKSRADKALGALAKNSSTPSKPKPKAA